MLLLEGRVMKYAIYRVYVDFPMGSSFPDYRVEYGRELTKEQAETIVSSLNDKVKQHKRSSCYYEYYYEEVGNGSEI